MKICYISHGSFTHIKPHVEYFSQAGHDVILLSLAPGPDYGVKTYDLSVGSDYSSKLAKLKYIISSFKARKLVKEIQPDIVHAHYATSGGLAAMICGYHPCVVTVHGSELTQGKDSKIWRPLLKVDGGQSGGLCEKDRCIEFRYRY